MRLFFCLLFTFSGISAWADSYIALDVHSPKWNWMNKQITEEFKDYQRKGIHLSMINDTYARKNEISFSGNVHRLKIINGKVYGPDIQTKKLLEEVASLYPVPDVDMIVFDQDIIWNPYVLRCPVMVTCMTNDLKSNVIHCPLQCFAEYKEWLIEIAKAKEHSPWESKIPQMFWRGVANDGNYAVQKIGFSFLEENSAIYPCNSPI